MPGPPVKCDRNTFVNCHKTRTQGVEVPWCGPCFFGGMLTNKERLHYCCQFRTCTHQSCKPRNRRSTYYSGHSLTQLPLTWAHDLRILTLFNSRLKQDIYMLPYHQQSIANDLAFEHKQDQQDSTPRTERDYPTTEPTSHSRL